MELLKPKGDAPAKSDRLIRNVSDEAWSNLKELAELNGVTIGKMFELLIDNFLEES